MAENDQKVESTQPLVKKLSAGAWGVFFIWMGIAFLTNMSWGVVLIGVGVIVLGGEAALRSFGLPVGWFWLMIGSILVVWGVCELLKIQIAGSLLPILSIMVGLAILITNLRPHPRH
jgi:hypothetical protein